MRISKDLKITGYVVLLIITSPVWIGILLVMYSLAADGVLRAQGYYVGGVGWELAEKLIEQNLPVTECQKFRNNTLALFTPSAGEQRGMCISTFAKLAGDATACGLLMPSDYGLSCINQSIDNVFKDNPDAEHVDINSNCTIYSSNPLRKDYCFFSKAHKSKDLKDCAQIVNSAIKSSCEEKIGAWYKYPQLRTSTYFGQYREQ